MRVIARKTLVEFWRRQPRSEQPLRAWFGEVSRANWNSPQDIKDRFRSASFVGDRVVFNICGNHFRLVCWVNYPFSAVYIRFVGTHAEYDRINVEDV